jgi:hypothetical protein
VKDSQTNIGAFRISFTLMIFFGFHAFLSSSLFFFFDSYVRLWLQKRLFFIKAIAFSALYIACHWIPTVVLSWFATICMIIAFVYMIIQILCVIDFSYRWNELWTSDREPSWLIATLIFSGIFILLSLIITVYSYWRFTGCGLNYYLILFSLLTNILLIALSVIIEHGSILPASVIMLYTTFQSFEILLSNPDNTCMTSQVSSSWLHTGLSTIFMAVSLMHSALFVSSVAKTALSLVGTRSDEFANDHEFSTNDEQNASFFYFHIFMIMCSTYMAMTLSGWNTIRTDDNFSDLELGYDFGKNWRSVYIKIVFLITTISLYFWSLVAPIVCNEREF